MDRSSPSSSSLSLLSFALSRRWWRGSGRSRAAGELVDGDCGLNSSGKPGNFMFHVKLFLGITNMDKRAKIDVGKLSL